MQTATYTQLRNNLSAMMDQVNDGHEPILITRGNSTPAVLVALDDYNAFHETAYLMSNKTNARRLEQAISDLKQGKGNEHPLTSCD